MVIIKYGYHKTINQLKAYYHKDIKYGYHNV